MAFQGLLMTGGHVLDVAGVEVVAVFSVVGIASHDRLSDEKQGGSRVSATATAPFPRWAFGLRPILARSGKPPRIPYVPLSLGQDNGHETVWHVSGLETSSASQRQAPSTALGTENRRAARSPSRWTRNWSARSGYTAGADIPPPE
ncbi:hypothetical protein Aph01nite_36530 [Acrocarpospora phusangensis]|uniref:Uncharacterized protein n=1 Tax=Acrocarpospora phusangensis TaxID=1070424 RepID=A0A919QB02_9ACTN|nr:hypothetical protein [Acrocarpospora phusangensis]GIH25343.1 hypothetical protein Aph01nite_36530 [Acrocarpospora phusangensis]